MRFSIVIPVYNVESYLKQCLDSVLGQSFQNFEMICINDGSTDNSKLILDEYSQKDNRIKVISQQNKGLSAARNRGIEEATGDYIFFLDSDDWIEPNSLKILAENTEEQDLICFNGRRYFEDGTQEEPDKGITEKVLTGWEYYNKYALVARKFHFVCTVLRIYKREFLLNHNLFFKEGIYHEDNLFTPIVCYYAKSVKVLPDILYVYRIRNGSITNSIIQQRIFDIVKVANELSVFFMTKHGINKHFIYREISGEYFKGFTPSEIEKYGNNDKVLYDLIDWESFKTVSIYSRHKRIYWFLKISPRLFRLYLSVEDSIKKKPS
jgi:glycosyltransferase involved in cell wall biosynthesis